MNTHITAVCGGGPFQIRAGVLLKNSVAALVDGGEHGRQSIIFIIMVCHSDIVHGKAQGEGMLALPNSAGLFREANIIQKQILHFSLGVRVKVGVKFAVIRLRGSQDLFYQWNQSLFQFLKYPVDGGGIHAFLIAVQKHLINISAGIGVSALSGSHVDHFFQMRCKEREIRTAFRLLPGLHGSTLGGNKLRKEFLRDSLVLLKFPFHIADGVLHRFI